LLYCAEQGNLLTSKLYKMKIFDENTLHEEIVSKWGEHGAHIEVYNALLRKTQFAQPKVKLTHIHGEESILHNRVMIVTELKWKDNILQVIVAKSKDADGYNEFAFYNNGNNEFWHRHENKFKAELI
jgi:hypothetical protein